MFPLPHVAVTDTGTARCRPPADAKDDVATGLHGNLITQRLKLNSRVALVTGAAGPRLQPVAHSGDRPAK